MINARKQCSTVDISKSIHDENWNNENRSEVSQIIINLLYFLPVFSHIYITL